uniref:Variant surface glycoprotein 1125.4071 n=1 Tax=Trypanosoma brucei TaxID=5691 RepID=A0A1J0R9Y3_9TRYP|nr:variant surface glycoprotein 1125.4071 [Trypanosoma brucei]
MKARLFKTALILSLSNLATIITVNANDTNTKHAVELDSFCRLLTLTEQAPAKVEPAELDQTAVRTLAAINMSLSKPEWRKQFPTTAEAKSADPEYCKGQNKAENCKEIWQAWEDAAIAAEKTDNLPGKLKLPSSVFSSPLRKSALQDVSALLAEATAITKAYTNKTKPELEAAGQPLRTKLNMAVFGKATKPNSAADACDVDAASDRQTTCTITKQPPAACTTAVCLCGEQGAQDQKICTNDITATVANWGSGKLNSAFQPIFAKCKQTKTASLTSASLIAAIADFTSRSKQAIVSATAYVIIGTASSSTHACATSQGAGCVDLTPIAGIKTGSTIRHKTWLSELEEAAQIIATTEAATQAKKIAESRLHELEKNAAAIYTQLLYAPADVAPSPPTTPKKTDEIPTAMQQSCTKHKNNKKDCTEANNCIWKGGESEKGDCEVNTTKVAEQAKQAGTGEGATSGADPNCGQYTDPEKCAKAPGKKKEGKNAVCGWIEGNFQNSSTLINNKFALISSSFASSKAIK